MKEYYSTSETADIFKVTSKTIRNWDKEGIFVPVRRDGEDRLYSRQQVEEKLGITIEETLDPIMALNKEGVDALLWIAKDNVQELYFDTLGGDTTQEKFKTLYMKVIERSSVIYRKVKISAANWLLASPEMAVWFEVGTSGFDPTPYKEEKSEVKYLGVVNSRWRLYSTPLLDPDVVMIGVKINHELLKTSDAIFVIKTKDWPII
jgi:DNA-binding transcriptional MerR regulator